MRIHWVNGRTLSGQAPLDRRGVVQPGTDAGEAWSGDAASGDHAGGVAPRAIPLEPDLRCSRGGW